MQLQTRLQVWRSRSPGSEIPAVNKVGALGQKQCWEVGDERMGNQKVRALAPKPLFSPLVCLHAAALIFEAKWLNSSP